MINKILLFLLLTSPLMAREKLQGFCEQGGQVVTVNASVNSISKSQKSYPGCTVTVYLSGTTTLAALYADNAGTSKANPFTADGTTGAWFAYTNNGRYDVRFSGGGIVTPFTRGDFQAYDSVNVQNFGAVGNGTTDDTAAIQAAINFAITNGQVLNITESSGCYKITSTLLVTSGLTIRGGYQDGVSPQICYYGNAANDAILVGGPSGGITFRVVLDGFAIICPTGCDSAVELQRFSEGEVNLTIGSSAYPATITTGVYCNQCFIGKISSTISTVTNGVWFSTTGFGSGYVAVRDSNIFETTNGIRVSQGGNIYIENSYVENFDVGLLLDNSCGLAGCVINNLVVRASYFVTNAASTHTSPVAISYAPSATPPGSLLYGTFTNNLLFVTKFGGGTSPYVVKFDINACGGCASSAWFDGNSIEGGTTSSFYSTSGNVLVTDRGGNYYRLLHLDVERPNSEIYSGTVQFSRWDYRQYLVKDPRTSGGNTLLTVAAALNQVSTAPTLQLVGSDEHTDLNYYGRTALAWRADTTFSWQKTFGVESPSVPGDIYGFGTFGTAGAFSYLFTGKDRNHPFQTWFPLTGNTSIGDTVVDLGAKLEVKGGIAITEGYGPTTNRGNTNFLQIGAKGAGAPYSASFAWGDATGYRIGFGPVIAGTFTPKFYIVDSGIFGSVGIAFASLGAPSNGGMVYCTDCTIANPCAGAGSGAFAKRLNGVWVCN